MPGSAQILLRLLLVAIMALASVAVPRLHIHAGPHDLADTIDLAAYALPDGTLPELCLSSDGGGEGDGHPSPPHCFACRLVAAPGILPADPGFHHPLTTAPAPVAPLADAPVRPSAVAQQNHARAPPAVSSRT